MNRGFALGLVLATPFIAALLAPQVVEAAPLYGVVLTVIPGKSEAVVRHDPSGSDPGSTTLYRVRRDDVARLRAGDEVEARVDATSSPATLQIVGVTRASPQTSLVPGSPVHIVQVGDLIPSAVLVDQNGRPFSLAGLRGQIGVVAFIYTRCPDPRECPVISAKFHTLQERLRGQPVHLVEVTLDPAYDQPAVMARYGRALDADPARWTLAGGDVATVLDFEKQFGIVPFDGGHDAIIHSERTVIFDSAGRIRDTIDEASWSPDEVVAAVRVAQNLSSNPIARLDLWLSEKAVAMCGNGVAGFSGLLDLAIVAAIFTVSILILYRIARHIAQSA